LGLLREDSLGHRPPSVSCIGKIVIAFNLRPPKTV